jgi:hypothetical protein
LACAKRITLGLELKFRSFPACHSSVRQVSGCAMPNKARTATVPSNSKNMVVHMAGVDLHSRCKIRYGMVVEKGVLTTRQPIDFCRVLRLTARRCLPRSPKGSSPGSKRIISRLSMLSLIPSSRQAVSHRGARCVRFNCARIGCCELLESSGSAQQSRKEPSCGRELAVLHS